MIVTGTSVAASEEAVRLAREYPGKMLRIGLQPELFTAS
jgi:hypothetical protein